jgi:polyisoprenoid-binding protein YceI
MKLKLLIAVCLLCIAFAGTAQSVYFTRTATVKFFSKTSVEDIKAINQAAVSFLDIQKGEITFAVLIKSFKFPNALMEDHFNENYLESDKYPKASFSGTIKNIGSINLQNDGKYNAEVEGKLLMHGVTQPVLVKATLVVKQHQISATSDFVIKLADYKIKIPSVVSSNIAETIAVTVICAYQVKQ